MINATRRPSDRAGLGCSCWRMYLGAFFRCLPISWPHAVATRASGLWGGCIKRECALTIAQEWRAQELPEAVQVELQLATRRSRCGFDTGTSRKEQKARFKKESACVRTQNKAATDDRTLPVISNSPSRPLGMSFRRLDWESHRTERSQSASDGQQPKAAPPDSCTRSLVAV